MNKKFIYFKTKTQFTAKLSSLPNNAIVFIEDTKQIWTHGVFFDTSWNYVGDKPDTYTPSAHTLGSHSDVTLAALANGNILRYNGSKWVNNTLAEAGIASTGQLNNYLPLSGGTISGLITSTTSNTSAAFYKSSSTGTAFARIGASTHDKGFGVSNTGEFIFGDWSGVSSLSSSWNKVWHSGNLANGNTTQYIRGDGSLATYSDTTYSTGTLAQLNAGNDTTGRLHTAKNLNDWLNGKNYATVGYVDELEIGGRNLFRNSGNFGTTVANWNNNGGGLVIDTVEKYNGYNTIKTTVGAGISGNWYKLENGKEYTYSALIKSNEVFTGTSITPIHYHSGLNNVHQSKLQVLKFDTSYTASDLGKYKLLYITFKLTGDADSFKPFIYFYGGGTRIFNIAYLKLEKGNKATDWTPAPEDQVSDWNTTNVNSFSYIKNKPTKLSEFSNDLGNYGNWITKAQGDGYYAPKSHTHSYLPLSGGTLSGNLIIKGGATSLTLERTGSYNSNMLFKGSVGEVYVGKGNGDNFAVGNNPDLGSAASQWLYVDANGVKATTFIGALTGNATTATTATNLSRSIIAGNGLTGGGVLNADRTITLGTPSNITATSTNSVTATSHTHNLVMGSGSGLDADLLDGYHSDFFRNRYNAIIKKGVWSRILYATPINLFGSFMLTIQHTRSSVVVGNVFLVTFGHSGHGQITALGTHGYTQIQVRLTGDANNIYFEVLESGGPDGDLQTTRITLDNINANITTYTSFTDGSTLSGSIKSEVSTVNNRLNVDGSTVAYLTDNVASATKLASIPTTFTGTYPVTFNVNGNIYSHSGITYTGSTNTLTATNFNGNLTGLASLNLPLTGGALSGDLKISNANSLQTLILASTTGSQGTGPGLGFSAWSGVVKGGIGFTRDTSYGRGSLRFYTNSDADSLDISESDERMRISYTGNVGIGTTSPAYKLDVSGTGRFTGNGLIVTTSVSQYANMLSDSFEVRRQSQMFRVTSSDIQMSKNGGRLWRSLYSGVLGVVHFTLGGGITYQWTKDGSTMSLSNTTSDPFRINHSIGHSDYFAMPLAQAQNGFVRPSTRYSTYCNFTKSGIGSGHQITVLFIGSG